MLQPLAIPISIPDRGLQPMIMQNKTFNEDDDVIDEPRALAYHLNSLIDQDDEGPPTLARKIAFVLRTPPETSHGMLTTILHDWANHGAIDELLALWDDPFIRPRFRVDPENTIAALEVDLTGGTGNASCTRHARVSPQPRKGKQDPWVLVVEPCEKRM